MTSPVSYLMMSSCAPNCIAKSLDFHVDNPSLNNSLDVVGGVVCGRFIRTDFKIVHNGDNMSLKEGENVQMGGWKAAMERGMSSRSKGSKGSSTWCGWTTAGRLAARLGDVA